MNPNLPPPAPVPAGTAGTPVPKRRPLLLYGCGILLGLMLLVLATVAITVWYLQRPIKPVELSSAEKAAVEKKLDRLSGTPASVKPAPGTLNPAPRKPNAPTTESAVTMLEQDRHYEPGGKVLRLTERELNGLLNANTELGQTVRLELGRDAINAYIVAPIPEDFPIMGGKVFRARGRFRVALTNSASAYAILEDVTVFGVSLPKAWLGGMKGENLLGDAMGSRNGTPVLNGIKSLRVEPGALVLEVTD
jgi:hypothetical protein